MNLVLSLIALLFLPIHSQCSDAVSKVSWTVVGAGPSGILTMGRIVDSGVPCDQIVWLDTEFNVGRMGKLYRNVPGNGRIEQYIALLQGCNVFGEVKSEAIDHLFSLPLDHAPQLSVFVEPLLDITNYLRTKVVALEDEMVALDFHDDQWHIQTKQTSFCSDNVVLATGSHPRQVHYKGVPQIPLDIALDKTALAEYVSADDRVALIGSGHSAMLILKHLTELPVASIVNFYSKPIVYPVPMRGGIAWQEAGLKGDVAVWAKTVFEVNPPANVARIVSTPEAIESMLPECTKVIFAVGFDRNELPAINGDASIYENYDRSSGVIAPRLFGIGIAFPQEQADPLGNVEELVGLPYLRFDALDEALGKKAE